MYELKVRNKGFKCHILGYDCEHDLTTVVVPALDPHKTGPGHILSVTGWSGAYRTRPLLDELLTTDRFGGKGVTVFSCIPTGEPTRFHEIVPH